MTILSVGTYMCSQYTNNIRSAEKISGGTAGCVIARRLAEDPETSVLLPEAGKSKDVIPASAIPAAVSQILGTDADWNIQSEPCAELNNRQLHLGRGKFMNGSSGCNGTLCIRGIPQNYDDWGVEGWCRSEMFEYMRKSENFQNKDWFDASSSEHGEKGPLTTAPHDPAPISSLVLESCQSKGMPLKPDMFTTGEAARGCGHAVRTIHEGVQTTSLDYIGSHQDYPSLQVVTGQYVDSVILEERGGELVAVAVQVQTASGQKIRFKASKEIILASGAHESPAVLLRSGIGPMSELRELGVSARVNLPGVGKNLMDHLVSLNANSQP
jgi:choline dehydrogenase-like flavoprotein